MYVRHRAYQTDCYDVPKNNLDKIIYYGTVKFNYEFDGGFYESNSIENPTWLDALVLANEMIVYSKEYSDIFLDGVSIENNVIQFLMGCRDYQNRTSTVIC
jgi:hypothetical protein